MRVDSHISSAFEKYLRANNMTAKELCQILGISEPAFIKWRRPGNGILPRNWEVVFPMIKEYLPKERLYTDERGEEQYSSMLEGTGGNPYFVPKYVPQMVPVFTFDQLEKFPYIVQSVEQYAINMNAQRIEYRPRTQGAGVGIFAINIDFENGVIPIGALVFASSELRPKNNSIVFYVAADGKLNLGKFQLTGDKYSIASSNNYVEGTILNIRENVSWIFPVLYYEVVTF